MEGLAKKLPGFGGVENSWGSGKNVRFGIKVVASTQRFKNFTFDNLYIHDIYPTPNLPDNIHMGYGIKLETQSDTVSGMFNTISNVKSYQYNDYKDWTLWFMDKIFRASMVLTQSKTIKS